MHADRDYCSRSPSFIAAKHHRIMNGSLLQFRTGRMATCRTLKIWAKHLWWPFYDILGVELTPAPRGKMNVPPRPEMPI